MSPGRTACAVLGLLLLLSGCGDAATGLPDPVDLAAASAAAVATDAVDATAVAGPASDPAVASPVASGAAGAAGPPGRSATVPGAGRPGVVQPGPAGAVQPGPAGAPAPSTSRAFSAPTPAVRSAPSRPATAPTRPQVAPPPAGVTQNPGPVRTPAPVEIDPITAYTGPLGAFRADVADKCKAKFNGSPDCLTIVPSTRQDGVTIDDLCIVRGSDPDLHRGLAIDPERVPVTVSVDVECDPGSL